MQQTNYHAIVKNARFFKHILGKSRLCAVLKNDAYGHGIVRVASALSGVADYFAVGNFGEAVAVSLFCPNILILLPFFEDDKIRLSVQNGFNLTVDSFFTLNSVQKNVRDGKKAKIHLKIDTGMNRLGFSVGEISQLLREIDPKKIDVEGVFSHFWGQTEESCDLQLQKFFEAYNFLVSNLPQNHKPIAHIANTSATLLSEKYHLDMARVGLGLYGYGHEKLVPAKKVSAHVVAVRKVSAGQTVGYDASHRFARDTRIAIVNIGYANGFSRALAPAVVKINNNLFPTVGTVCMAMCAVDIGNAPVSVGDEAILLGDGVNNANSKVIVYELLCNLK